MMMLELDLDADGCPGLWVYADGGRTWHALQDLVDHAIDEADVDHPRMRGVDLEVLADALGRLSAHVLERAAGVGTGTRAQRILRAANEPGSPPP